MRFEALSSLGSSWEAALMSPRLQKVLIKGKLGDAVVIFVFGYQLFLGIYFFS